MRMLFFALTILLMVLGVFVTLMLNSDFGKIEVTSVVVTGDDLELSGLLYRPKPTSPENLRPRS